MQRSPGNWANRFKDFNASLSHRIDTFMRTGLRIPIATKLILSFLAVIIIISTIFTIVGIRLISDRILTQAQQQVGLDLNSATGIYQGKLNHINDIVRLTADRFFLANDLSGGNIANAADELLRVKKAEGFDILNVTDAYGDVILRTSNLGINGDSQIHNQLISTVISTGAPAAATIIISADDLKKESPALAQQADIKFISTPMERITGETEQSSGMMMGAAAPIFDQNNKLIGVLCGGILLNRNYSIVDEIRQTVFQGLKYNGKDAGTATIFQNDVRISTNVSNEDGSRAIGTRVSQSVFDQVVLQGQPYIGRAYVVNNWYITAYEPIKDVHNEIIGILYVGILEQPYANLKSQIILTFLGITFAGALASMLFAYFISQKISVPIRNLVAASKELANGNLDVKLEPTSGDELGKLSYRFNKMAEALRQRDERLKEFTKRKIMESERLAIVGQLAANVAHELNNPLQGIVTYSHLLLEAMPVDEEETCKSNLEKIAIQADRCRDIIRGLLDFSRQKKPIKALTNINELLRRCVSLVENQAQFHNIAVVQNLDESLPMIIVDPSQIERVFLNLIINAAEAMNGSGMLTLTTSFGINAKNIEIEVKDTGHGISEENMEKIFNPFFTTKEIGHGVGLGLAISYGIVKEHNGEITVESESGKGAKFTVSLPIITKVSEEDGNKVKDFAD